MQRQILENFLEIGHFVAMNLHKLIRYDSQSESSQPYFTLQYLWLIVFKTNVTVLNLSGFILKSQVYKLKKNSY